MAVEVKICGITNGDAADAAVKARADYVGLVAHPKSPRYLHPQLAGILAERVRGRARLVALLADAGDEAIAGVLAVVKPDFLQLHGSETPARVAAIKGRFGVAIIKALPVAAAEDLASVPAYEQAADMLLFDARAPERAAYPGGHGAAFDWQLLRGRTFARPWLLAGGLNAQNVARAIAVSGAPGVDVSTGVETEPGRKSPELVRAFVEAARATQLESES